MKKRGTGIGVLSIVFSAMFLFVSSGTKAETPEGAKKDLASELHIEAASLLGPKEDSGEKKDRGIAPLRTFLVPLQEGLHAFFDLASPPHPGLLAKDSRTDYRAVVGFHFNLN